ncbi:MAG: carboxypeptidase regulatory-like domain-containing protein [Acidobacteriaceae bacterium]|nr:carboxypeptidase regulatory-like domain-containing protein [Acidobacteriaceae bacterium]
MMKHKGYRIPLLSLILVLACVAGYAQSNSTITGTVVDKQAAAVAGAELTLTNPATGVSVTTTSNGSGVFTFPGLNVGTYDLKVTAKGFETYLQTGLQVNVSQVLRADVTLTVGAVNETVTVAAQALQVQTDSNVVSTLISGQQIEKIATENRNFAALAALGMGVSSALPDNNTPTSVAANFTLSVNGLRQSHNIWLIDGGEADDRGAPAAWTSCLRRTPWRSLKCWPATILRSMEFPPARLSASASRAERRSFMARRGSSTATPITTPTITLIRPLRQLLRGQS